MKNYILIVVLFFSFGLCAQNIYTGYYSNAFLLKSNLNPAAFPEENVILGFPAFSNFNFGMQLPLSLNELFEKGKDDSLRLNIPSIPSFIDYNDVLSLNVRHQIFYLGFKVGKKKNIFTYIGDEIVADFRLRLSSSLVDYFTNGNAQFLNRQMNFNNEQLNGSIYNSLFIGISSTINDKLNIGTRLKILNGIGNVNTKKINLGFYTDSTSVPIYQTNILADMNINTSGMGLITDTLSHNPLINSGFAFDIGASYKYNNQLEFSVALNDIGSINWAEENNQFYTTEGEVEFIIDGLTYSSSGDENLENQLEEITDSLISIMEPIKTSGSYKTKLNSSLYLGLSYSLNKKHSFSLLFHARNNLDSRLNVFNIGYQYQVVESLQLLASYQNFNGLSNLGTGFVWTPGKLQMHLIIDNILAVDLFDAKNIFLQLGFSLKFGKKLTV